MTQWAKRLGAPVALIAAISATLWPGFSNTHVFFYRDLSFYFYPVPQLAWKMLRQGELPLWNPYCGFGIPLAAMPDVLLYYPITWLRFALPFPLGFNFVLIFHFYLAALGTWWLARHLGMTRAGAFVAAICYTLSGPMLSTGSMTNVLVAVAWLPICLLAIRWAAAEPSAWRIMVLGLTLALQAIGGEPMFNMAAAALAIPLCGVTFWRLAKVLTPGAFFGMALIGVQLIPGLELLRKSLRHTDRFTFTNASAWSLHPVNLLETLVPDVMFGTTGESFQQFLYGVPRPYLNSIYLGLLPLALAIWALSRSDKREVPGVAAMGGLFLLVSFGAHTALYTVLYKLVPFVASSRYPSKMMTVVAFCVALLAGWGWDSVMALWTERRPLRWRFIIWPLAVVAGLLLRIVFTEASFRSWIVTNLLRMFPGPLGTIHAGKLAALAMLLVLAIKFAPRRPALVTAIFLACLTADLAQTGFWVNPTAPQEVFISPSPLLPLIGTGSRDFRVDDDVPDSAGMLPIRDGWTSESLSALETRWVMQSGAQLEGVRFSRNFSPNLLYAPEYLDWRHALAEAFDHRRHAILGNYNVRYFITTAQKAAAGPPLGMHEAGRVHTLNHELVVWEMDQWSPRAEIPGGQVRVTRENASTVELSTDSRVTGTLELRESYDDGWRARVDGLDTPVSRSAHGFRTVPVPAGKHVVEFRYRPLSFPVGLAISFAAILAFLMTGWKSLR